MNLETREGRKKKKNLDKETHRKKTSMNASIVPGFEILIHHIITPARKETSISPRRRHVSMEKQRILAHNRSVLRKRRAGQRDQRLGLRRLLRTEKMDDVDL